VAAHLLAHEKRACEIDIDYRLPLFTRGFQGRRPRGDAGTVDQHVEFAEFASDLCQRLFRTVLGAQVKFNPKGTCPTGFERCDGVSQATS
jgi:hypothetical protein